MGIFRRQRAQEISPTPSLPYLPTLSSLGQQELIWKGKLPTENITHLSHSHYGRKELHFL